MHGLQAPSKPLDLGNSGTSMRLLSGLLAGQGIDVKLVGDSSLSSRPMRRVTEPLAKMGAAIDTTEKGTAPLHIKTVDKLLPLHYEMPMASAQVKSCILLAGLYADGQTCVTEPAPTRDHTERMLSGMGYPVERKDATACLQGGGRLSATPIDVPADISSAAFFLVGASIAFYQQHPEYLRRLTRRTDHVGNRQSERLGLLVMCLIAKRHFEGTPAPSTDLLASELKMPMAPVADCLELLLKKGLIIAVGSTPETYLPGRAPERIELQTVLDVLRRADEKPDPLTLGPAPGQSVAEILAAVEQANARALNGLTVRDLLLGRVLSDAQAVNEVSAR